MSASDAGAPFPAPLPLDGAELIASASDMQLIMFAVAFGILCLALSLFAAVTFARSKPSRYRRFEQWQDGVGSSPEVDPAPFSNLLSK